MSLYGKKKEKIILGLLNNFKQDNEFDKLGGG